MRREVPIIVTLIAGLLFLLDYFIKIPLISGIVGEFETWAIVISAFALGLGAANLFRIHLQKAIKKSEGWYNSVLLLVSMVVMAISGIGWTQTNSIYSYMFDNIFVPINGTMFALLAFYLASASYRAFRVRTPEATVLLVSAVIVMVGNAPVGRLIWEGFPGYSSWIMSVFNSAGMRGIIIGASLGAIVTSLRIIFGIDRSYFGGQ
ncbi:hypothetical protein HYG86_07045 [Alkalicella caledoniensis]|uniref:Uncharacterized protein n=1 Tax=Alkalicella caledoniensis TaxID=2731377 RepID=A0A7G9W791_ALKCA|nr:hypothetical protein [Alkalicella caledoniensis]QNO14553.1 hypothetical protein HYG86_07045 [Alkalicella caledoniensis]